MMEDKTRTYAEQALERELDALFAAYRLACPAPEPSPNFMPELWQKIEAGRSVSYSFTRLTQAFVTAAAAICLVLVILQTTLKTQPSFYTQTYVEALADASADESPVYSEVSFYDMEGASYQ
jgi:hypothetical protein